MKLKDDWMTPGGTTSRAGTNAALPGNGIGLPSPVGRGLRGLLLVGLLLVNSIGPASAKGLSQRADSTGERSSYAILTDLPESDSYFTAVRELAEWRRADVVLLPLEDMDRVLGIIRQLEPLFVAVVVRPETIDVNLAYDMLEMSTRVDADPFPDFAYGFITGATPADAVAFVRNIIAAEENGARFPKRVFTFGPSSVPQATGAVTGDQLVDWDVDWLSHTPGRFPKDRLDDLTSCGMIRFWGHGVPSAITDGLSSQAISGLDVFPAVVFAGPCFSGVTSTSYTWSGRRGRMRSRFTEPGKTLALTFVAAGCTGYFGAIHKNRCLSAAQEMEYGLMTGEPLGMIAKHTYDRLVMARRGERLGFPRLAPGRMPPREGPLDFQVNRAASRILLGDPAFDPLGKELPAPVSSLTRLNPETLQITVMSQGPRGPSASTNPFRSDLCSCRKMNDVVYTKIRLPRGLGRIEVVQAYVGTDPVSGALPDEVLYLEEQWSGQRILHVQQDLRHGSLDKAGFDVHFIVQTGASRRAR